MLIISLGSLTAVLLGTVDFSVLWLGQCLTLNGFTRHMLQPLYYN